MLTRSHPTALGRVDPRRQPYGIHVAPPIPHHTKKGSEDPEEQDTGSPDIDDELLDPDRPGRIRCPQCQWRPRKSDRWMCRCGWVWNTFDTQGLCPDCGFRWTDTQCLACHQWSLHLEWYEKADEAR